MSRSSGSEPSIEELLRQVRAKEPGAWEDLLRRSQTALDAWAAQRIGQTPPAGARPSDVAQEAALWAFERFSSFEGQSEGEWRAWLKRVLDSRFIDMARRAGSQKRDDGGAMPLDALDALRVPAPERSPSLVSSQNEEWRQLLTHFYHLPENQREALSLYYLEELPLAGIAARMGKTQTAVDSLLQRGVRTIRRLMSGQVRADPEDAPCAAMVQNAADAALLIYLRRREAGEHVDPDAFAAGYPACAEELRGLLHWLEKLRALRPSRPA